MIAVSRWISDYLARYPLVNVESDFTGRIVDIVHEGFDLAIRIGPLSDSSLAARRLGELRYGSLCQRRLSRAPGNPRNPGGLGAARPASLQRRRQPISLDPAAQHG
jgi:DNA-binding transcriptional LysR family regulator